MDTEKLSLRLERLALDARRSAVAAADVVDVFVAVVDVVVVVVVVDGCIADILAENVCRKTSRQM